MWRLLLAINSWRPSVFGQGQGLAGQGLGPRPVFPVQRQRSQIARVSGHALGVTDRAGYPQRLAIIPLRRREIAGVPSQHWRGQFSATATSCALGGQAAVQIERLAIGGDGGGVILLQAVTVAAQLDGGGALAGAGLRGLPVRRRAVGTSEHRVRLLAQLVNLTRLDRPASRPVVIAGRHGLGFRLL